MKNETIINLFENTQVGFMINSNKVISGDNRLDSSHFVDDSNIELNSNIKFQPLRCFINNVEEPKLFTRIYCDKEFGVPYISSSEMSEIEPPVNTRFISKILTNNIDQYIIKRGQILVSAAGTVGSIVVATKELNGVAGTSDILRINVDQNENLGFVYTYLTSSFGANELANLAYGAIIKRIRGFHLAELKTPVIENEIKHKMNKLVLEALEKRDEANILIQKARFLVHHYNKLSLLEDVVFETIDSNKMTQIKLTNLTEFTNSYRLDSHFYNPISNKAIDDIKLNSVKLSEITSSIFMCDRFNRNYVEDGYGLPFLSGKNTIQIRPDVKYISISETSSIEDLKLKKGWITITRSGTLGRVCFVWNNYEDFTATEDLIRVVANDETDSGYLYAFLSCDYGFHQILRYKHGAVIDHLSPEDMNNILVPVCKQQKEIGDLVRKAYDLRAEAIRLEDEAQEILTQALTKNK